VVAVHVKQRVPEHSIAAGCAEQLCIPGPFGLLHGDLRFVSGVDAVTGMQHAARGPDQTAACGFRDGGFGERIQGVDEAADDVLRAWVKFLRSVFASEDMGVADEKKGDGLIVCGLPRRGTGKEQAAAGGQELAA